jgi:AbrB family looped-hinge helix DNA binding protein
MQAKVSTKGQVVLPGPMRRRLGIQAGDTLDADVADGRIVLTPRRSRPRKVRIVMDPLTGLPVLTAGPKVSTLTSKQVREILASFP